MNVALVEYELLAVTYLKNILEKQDIVPIETLTILRSKKQAIEFLKDNPVDLIFMDIHLGDGKSFEIFEQIELFAPIIFITAYDEYAIKVFKLFTIDYILKPFEESQLELALHKFVSIRNSFDASSTLQSMVALEKGESTTINRFLVMNGHKFRSIEEDEVAYFFASGKHLFLTTKDQKTYIYDDTIKDIIHKLNPRNFFKINRKFIVHINSITEIIKHTSQKIEVKLEPIPEINSSIFVSKTQISEWKNWLNSSL